jgi:hypothetical protein
MENQTAGWEGEVRPWGLGLGKGVLAADDKGLVGRREQGCMVDQQFHQGFLKAGC